MTAPRPFRIAGFDLGGAHLGCACLEVDAARGLTLVARATIHVGEVVALPEPVTRTNKSGRTWVQTYQRVTGPEAFDRAAAAACAWAVVLGAEVAALEWIKDLHAGSHSPVLHAGQVGQALHGELRRAGVMVALYGRSRALALVRRLAVARGAPVLPGVVRSRGAELGPVLGALVRGWEGSGVERRTKEANDGRGCVGQVSGDGTYDGDLEVPAGHVQDAGASMDDGLRGGGSRVDAEPHEAHRPIAPSREDRRPEHEADACAVAVAHVAHLAGVVIEARGSAGGGTKVSAGGDAVDGAAPALPRVGASVLGGRRATQVGRGRLPAADCKACLRGIAPGPTHRKGCAEWRKWSA